MKIVIAGAGDMGIHLARMLSGSGHDITVADLEAYRNIISRLHDYDKSCGFICSKSDLANWNPFEIWSLINGTKDYYGKLSALAPSYTEYDIRSFVKLSVNNLYHEICHRYIHSSISSKIVFKRSAKLQ